MSPGGAAGAGGVSTPPTVTPISMMVAPASLKYWSAAFTASVVFVVPKGSNQVEGMKPMRLPRNAFTSSTERQSAGVWRPGADVSGSAGSTATTTLSMSARSGTERAITPPKSVRYTNGITPVPLSSPSVPRSVTSLAPLDGPYSESPVCEPSAAAASFAAKALADPPLEAIDDFDGLNTFQT